MVFEHGFTSPDADILLWGWPVLTSSFISGDPEETLRFGLMAGQKARPGEIWRLSGPLGAGKTAFIQGLAKGLDYSGRVTSPTFALQNIYEARLPLYHFDWYRLGSAEEVLDLGWDEWLSKKAVLAVEWGDKFPSLFPAGVLELTLEITGEAERRLVLAAQSPEAEDRVQEIIQCWPP
jgi:tRNA threonylcarbamoyladenosine biosynthesis protein TsaE